MSSEAEDSIQTLAANIESLARRAQAQVATVFAPETMTLPPGLSEEAARIIFEFWERNAEAERGHKPLLWEELPPRYQILWIGIARIVLEMAVTVLLSDIHRFFEDSNGDMGAAFAKALRRYAEIALSTKIT